MVVFDGVAKRVWGAKAAAEASKAAKAAKASFMVEKALSIVDKWLTLSDGFGATARLEG